MRDYLRQCRFFFLHAGLFSFFINLLLLTTPFYMMTVFNRVMTSRSNETLVMLTLAAFGAMLLWAALEALRSRLLVRAGVALEKLIGEKVLRELLAGASSPGGSAHPYALKDVNTVRNFLTGHSIIAFFDAPWAPLFLVIIYMFHPLFGIIATVGMILLFGIALLDEKITVKLVTEAQNQGRRTGQFVDQGIRNAEAVNAMGMAPAVAARWKVLNTLTMDKQILASNRSGAILAVTKFLRLALQVIMLCAGTYLVIDQNATPGVMMAATLILGRALAPVEMAIGSWKGLVEARNAYDRLDKMFGQAARRSKETLELPAPQGRLTVEKIVFGRSLSQLILRNVSFDIAAGESLGVIGPSAAGKSTLARLVVGVWSPLSGAVRLDGADISEWDKTHLGQFIGYLPQDVELFAGTVAENIARLDDPVANSDAIVAAAQRAFAHDMILRLPEGYDTEIGTGGVVLSGGQRQRIALARALYGNPRLVVLDEPNASLDGEGEVALMQSMAKMKEEGVTLIVITHKPSLLRNIDKMLVLQNGQVEAFGPRESVMNKVNPDMAQRGGRPQMIAEQGKKNV